MPTAAHFLYIPGVLLLGIVIGWILGSRAAADAYAAQLRQQSRSPSSATPKTRSTWHADDLDVVTTCLADVAHRPIASRCASTSGRPGGDDLRLRGGDVVGARA